MSTTNATSLHNDAPHTQTSSSDSKGSVRVTVACVGSPVSIAQTHVHRLLDTQETSQSTSVPVGVPWPDAPISIRIPSSQTSKHSNAQKDVYAASDDTFALVFIVVIDERDIDADAGKIPHILATSDAIILMYDVCNRLTFFSMPELFDTLRDISVPKALLGCNVGDPSLVRQVDQRLGTKLASVFDAVFIEIGASEKTQRAGILKACELVCGAIVDGQRRKRGKRRNVEPQLPASVQQQPPNTDTNLSSHDTNTKEAPHASMPNDSRRDPLKAQLRTMRRLSAQLQTLHMDSTSAPSLSNDQFKQDPSVDAASEPHPSHMDGADDPRAAGNANASAMATGNMSLSVSKRTSDVPSRRSSSVPSNASFMSNISATTGSNGNTTNCTNMATMTMHDRSIQSTIHTANAMVEGYTISDIIDHITSPDIHDIELTKIILMVYPKFMRPSEFLDRLMDRFDSVDHIDAFTLASAYGSASGLGSGQGSSRVASPSRDMSACTLSVSSALPSSSLGSMIHPVQIRVCNILIRWINEHPQDFHTQGMRVTIMVFLELIASRCAFGGGIVQRLSETVTRNGIVGESGAVVAVSDVPDWSVPDPEVVFDHDEMYDVDGYGGDSVKDPAVSIVIGDASTPSVSVHAGSDGSATTITTPTRTMQPMLVPGTTISSSALFLGVGNNVIPKQPLQSVSVPHSPQALEPIRRRPSATTAHRRHTKSSSASHIVSLSSISNVVSSSSLSSSLSNSSTAVMSRHGLDVVSAPTSLSSSPTAHASGTDSLFVSTSSRSGGSNSLYHDIDASNHLQHRQNRSNETSVGSLTMSPITMIRSLFEHDSDVIAQQLCLIEWDLFVRIKPRDLIHHLWSKSSKGKFAPNLAKSVDQFNRISMWVSSSILAENEAKVRAKVMAKFMRICQWLRAYNNYNSLMAVIAGINNSSISRLKQTHQYVVDRQGHAEFAELEKLMSSEKSFGRYRAALKYSSLPCIPYLGIFLRDLLYIDEANKDYKSDGSLNLQKFVLIGDTVLMIGNFQLRPYDARRNPAIIELIKSFPVMEEEMAYQRSLHLEPREAN